MRVRKRVLAWLMSALLVFSSVSTHVICAVASRESFPECDCQNGGASIGDHSDECALKVYLKEAADSKSARELFGLWDVLTADEQAFILDYLEWNEAEYAEKLAELNALISDDGLVASTVETVNGMTVTVKGGQNVSISEPSAEQLAEVEALYSGTEGHTYKVFNVDADTSVEGVQVSLSGLDIPFGTKVNIIHLLDNAEEIAIAEEAGTLQELSLPELEAQAVPDSGEVAEEVIPLDQQESAAPQGGTTGGQQSEPQPTLNRSGEKVYCEILTALVDLLLGKLRFTAHTFSTYVVDFYNGDLTYSIPGGSSVLLSQIFTELNYEYDVANVTNAAFSNPSLVEVTRQGNDWLLTSLQPFDTEEALTLTFADGSTYAMRVTDADATWNLADGTWINSDLHHYTAIEFCNPTDGSSHRFYIEYDKGWSGTIQRSAGNPTLTIATDAEWCIDSDHVVAGIPRVTGYSAKVKPAIGGETELNVKAVDVPIIDFTSIHAPFNNKCTVNIPAPQDPGDMLDVFSCETYMLALYPVLNMHHSHIQIRVGYYDFRVAFSTNAGSDTVTNMPNGADPCFYHRNLRESQNTHTFTDLPITRPSRDGYKFKGWNSKADGTGTNFGMDPTSVTINGYVCTEQVVTMYAQWEKLYTVTWKNWDGTVLETDTNLEKGTVPHYDGTTPTRAASAEATYAFKGWDGDITAAITGDTTFTAQYSTTTRQYQITWLNYDGTILRTDTLNYGAVPDYGSTPTRAGNAQYYYDFAGWSPAIAAVTGNATYTATFDRGTHTYTVYWKNYDGTVLETDYGVSYGTTPTYDGATPTKPMTADKVYTFKGWNTTVGPVTGDITYTAQFDEAPRPYNVWFVNYDGTELQSGQVNYGTTPTYNGATPTKPSTAKYDFTFIGWNTAVGPVTGDITYTAQYTAIIHTYTVTWKNYDGTVLEVDYDVPYDSTPTYNGTTPTKTGNAQYTYTFAGWDPAISTVKADVIYTAKFTESTNKYTITWVDEDGTVLETDKNVSYGATPTYNGATPTKATTAQYTYTFAGWTPAVTSVTGNATYKATYTPTLRKYTVTWVDDDGTTLRVDENVPYGTMPNNWTPTREATAQYTYTFKGWSPAVDYVRGDVTYTARWEGTVNKYWVHWENWDGSLLEKDTNVPYGTMPTYDKGTPTKPDTPEFHYEFTGWSPEVNSVFGNITYTATFSETKRSYTVVWKNWDDTVLETDTNVLYGTTPQFNQSTPTRPRTEEFTYNFAGWSPEVTTVTGDAVYTATYTSGINEYTITYKVEGQPDVIHTYEYGEALDILRPEKTYNRFDGWYIDEGYSSAWEEPATMPGQNIVVYGRFILLTTTFSITKRGMADGEKAIFRVTGLGVEDGLTVILDGNRGSVTIDGAFIGTDYTVTEIDSWSWKYIPAGALSQTVRVTADGTAAVVFSNTALTKPWLSGETSQRNVFGYAN